MRKIYIYIGIAALLGSCDIYEFPGENPVDPTLVNVALSLSVDPALQPYESANSSRTEEPCDVRWIVELTREGVGTSTPEQYIFLSAPSPEGLHATLVELPLHAAKYRLGIWANYVEGGITCNKYYFTSGLNAIAVPQQYNGSCEFQDAFSTTTDLDLTSYRDQWDVRVERSLTLSRPLARVELIATDLEKFMTQSAAHSDRTTPSSLRAHIAYTGYFPAGFNVYTDKPNEARTGVCFDSAACLLNDGNLRLAFDYVLVNGTESGISVDLTIFDDQGHELNRAEDIRIPIVRGRLTSVKDEFLTRSYSPGIGIDPDFDGDIDITIPD